MTRYAIDAATALRLVAERRTPSAPHTLVGPSALRTDALTILYGQSRGGSRSDAEGRKLLDGVAMLKIRLLGDRVSRDTAWKIAAQLDLDDPRPAEYLAVATLQADAIITIDDALRSGAERLGLAIATYDDLFR